ncbi:hypothetical protein [Micromonospora maritima]|uniref:hypothetical protein n=1 Tax=Micromonospora maritima TaxID=986711 RepID=UPI00157CE08B|nr:hypothetical protein [Micromonospora maritima]
MGVRFPDVQKTLAALLEPLAGGPGHAGSETPEDLQNVLPFIRIIRRPGGVSDNVNDYAFVDVDVFAARYDLAEPLAEDVRQFLTGRPHAVGPAVLDRITCPGGPAERPWGPGVRRFGATYRVVSRRYATS